MDAGTLTVALMQLALFAINGLLFFRRGRHTLLWFLTVLPFAGLLIALVVNQWFPLARLWDTNTTFHQWALVPLGTALCVLSVGVFGCAVGSHRIRIPMWHQPQDLPAEVVTSGAYAWVRHPFYSAYLIHFVGVALLVPAWPILTFVMWGVIMMWISALTEERQLLGSSHGHGYARYARHTGRFFPRLLAASTTV